MSEPTNKHILQFSPEWQRGQSAMDSESRADLQFRRACSKFPTGVTVTTGVRDDGMPYGLTVSSFTSVSLDPPLVLICIDHRSRIIPHLISGQFFGVNVLNEDQQELSARFARHSSEQFSDVSWYRGEKGVPLLCDVSASFECRLTDTLSAGDHLIVIGHVFHIAIREQAPLARVNNSYTRFHLK
jgi:flavin reductase (DIM6/NTAB) family NADH-FMN oxidoreductase RutF